MSRESSRGEPVSRYSDKQKLKSEPRYDDGIASYLQKLKFKRRIFGGLDEADVWRKTKGLVDRYESLLEWHGGGAVMSHPPDASDKRKKGKEEPVLSQANQAIRTKRRRIADKKEIASFFIRLVALAAFIYVMTCLVFGFAAMPNNDMSPRISYGDLLLYYRLDTNFSSGDVIVYEVDGTTYAGRVVARPGDEVEISEEGGLYINGSNVVENDIYYSTRAYDNDITYPIMLGENQVFVLGDYRDGAKDSRAHGAVDFSNIKGKVISVMRRSDL